MSDDFLESFTAAGLDMWNDYNEFLEDNFLCGEEPGNLGTEEHALQRFYGLYTSLGDNSGPFGEVLDALCEEDYDYQSCADDDERADRRDEIIREVSSHLLDGLYRCGKDRSEILQATNSFDEILSESRNLIDKIGGDVDPDEVNIDAMIDELRRPVANLASSLASSSWSPGWEENSYGIDEFAEFLRKLRTQQDRALTILKSRAEEEGSDLRSRFRQMGGQAE